VNYKPTADDIAAIRADGGLKALIDALTGRTPKPADAAPAQPEYRPPSSPLHRPGAWPAGTRTDRPTCHPDCDCAIHPPPAA
jgi:hypothetical protein